MERNNEPVRQEPVAWMWACTECGTEAEDGTDGRICSSCGYHKFYKAPKVATCVCAAKTQENVKQEQEHSADTGNMVYSKPSVFDGVCCGCLRKAAECWALYCVECWDKSNGDLFASAGKMIAGQAKQEPVAFIGQGLKPIVPEDLEKLRKHEPGTATLYDTSLYTHPVRTKDLTDSEIAELWVEGSTLIEFARAVIAKFKEKNK